MTDLSQTRPGARTHRSTSTRADFATLSGLVGGIALIAGAILMGGALTAFLDLPSVAIVLGGTLAVTVAGVGAGGVAALPRAMAAALARRSHDPLGA
ncbi:MAG: motility protein A, partial [Alphaproteobacteria bacterium]